MILVAVNQIKLILTSRPTVGVNLKILRVLGDQVDSKIVILKKSTWMTTGKTFSQTRMMTTSVIMCCVRILKLMKAPGAPLGGLVEVRFLEHFLVIKIFELILQQRAIDPLSR